MRRLLLLGTACVLVVTACGAGASPASRLSNVAAQTRPHLHAIAAARKRQALRRAGELLRRVALPPGARRIGEPAILAQPDIGVSVLNETAWRYVFWRVPLPLESVFAFEKAHRSRGFRYLGGGGLYRSLDFTNRALGSRERLLTVDLAPVAGGTAIRLEAGVAWIDPRSPKEALPSRVREIDVRYGRVKRSLKKPRNVARVMGWFDALNVAPRTQVFGCPFVSSSKLKFIFRSARGVELASATAGASPATGCSPVQFTLGGKLQKPLVDATFGRDTFLNRIQRLLVLPHFPER